MGAFVMMARGRTVTEALRDTCHPALDRMKGCKVVRDAGDSPYQMAMVSLSMLPFNDPACRKVGAVPMGGDCWVLFGREGG